MTEMFDTPTEACEVCKFPITMCQCDAVMKAARAAGVHIFVVEPTEPNMDDFAAKLHSLCVAAISTANSIPEQQQVVGQLLGIIIDEAARLIAIAARNQTDATRILGNVIERLREEVPELVTEVLKAIRSGE
jgi:DTW domain-containing protein YfiP